MTDAQKNELTDEICVAECLILKTVKFALEVSVPYNYIRQFFEALYPQELFPEICKNHEKFSLAICNDSFYTPCNIVYSGASVALACILFSAIRFNAPLPFDDMIDVNATEG